SFTEIAARRQLGDLPVPGKKRRGAGIDIHRALQRKRGTVAFQMDAGLVLLGADGEIGLAVVSLYLPVGRQMSLEGGRAQQHDGQLGGTGLESEHNNGAEQNELFQITSRAAQDGAYS